MYIYTCILYIIIYYIHVYICKNDKKTFSIKMKEDVGMSKPKKYVNKVRRLT